MTGTYNVDEIDPEPTTKVPARVKLRLKMIDDVMIN